jgi:hypothetical protein
LSALALIPIIVSTTPKIRIAIPTYLFMLIIFVFQYRLLGFVVSPLFFSIQSGASSRLGPIP